jgi:tyrosinase
MGSFVRVSRFFLNERTSSADYHYGSESHEPDESTSGRDVHRAELQRKYGLNPAADVLQFELASLELFNPEHPEIPPPGYTRFEHFRHFVVDVELVEQAFLGSYILSLRLQNNDIFVGNISVFTRSNVDGCAACRLRRDAGNIVHGIIIIPTKIIVDIPSERRHSIEELKSSFKASLARPDRGPLAHTTQPVEFTTMADLPEPITPKLRLRSAYACYPEGNKDGPVMFYGWEDHDDIFEKGDWKQIEEIDTSI